MYMNRDVLKQIIIDQKEMYLDNPLISRDYDLEENVNYCFVGIRRTGKSYMMYQQIHNLMNDGISSSQIIYVNFEDMLQKYPGSEAVLFIESYLRPHH